jgi:endonuclease YncB( thermonuclease family)
MVNRVATKRRATFPGRTRRVLDLVLAIVALGVLALVASRLDRVDSQELAGSAMVSDGDSLVMSGRRLRLRGMDAPELGQTCRRAGGDYACGREAREALRGLIAGRDVTCRGWELDRYQRLLVHCSAGGTDLNRAMVTAGWAVAYGDYAGAEEEARSASRGLWAGTFETPSRWRVVHGGAAEGEHDMMRMLANWFDLLFRSR